MSNFHIFALAVNKQYMRMAQDELFTTESTKPGDDLFAAYLTAFPPGTDPIFRTNTEHTCSCCKNFVRNLGALIGLADGKVSTVWDIPAVGHPYDTVAAKMAAAVRERAVKSIYRTKEPSYGAAAVDGLSADELRARIAALS